jgi:hypothetical protein
MKRRRFLGYSLAVAMLPAIPVHAQSTQQPFTPQQLDQMLAPVALYPDAVLAQTLMAATYPLEVVQAARWSKDNPNLNGDAAVAAVKDKDWDVSVKSLVAFPQILSMMNTNLDWTQKVGDAMIGQQKDVADSIQRLRARAQAAGNLKSTPQQTVSTQNSGGQNAIVIAPANPETVYVPYYNPTWAYGQWPYPSYPPVYYPPPSYYGTALLSGMMFGLGVAATASLFGGWHWGWSGGGWGGSYSTVNVNRAVNISGNNFNASRYADGRWNFDAAHRDSVPYRTQAERQMYNQVRPDAQQREQFRGQLEGRGAAQARPNVGAGAERPNVARGTGERASAFDGVERGGQVNRDYSRGSQSWGNRSFEGSNFSRGGGGGFERGGGGFERGGGGFRR